MVTIAKSAAVFSRLFLSVRASF